MGTHSQFSLGLQQTPLSKKRLFLSYAADDESARGFADKIRQEENELSWQHIPLYKGIGGAAAFEATPFIGVSDDLVILILSKRSVAARERIRWLVQAIQERENFGGGGNMLCLLPLDDVLTTGKAWTHIFGTRPVVDCGNPFAGLPVPGHLGRGGSGCDRAKAENRLRPLVA